MDPIYHDDESFLRIYALLSYLSPGRDLTDPAVPLLADAYTEFIDWGRHCPAPGVLYRPVDDTTARDVAFAEVDDQLTRYLEDSDGLTTTLRITRVRDLVREAVKVTASI